MAEKELKSQDYFRKWQELKQRRTQQSPTSLQQSTAVTDQDAEAELDVAVSFNGADSASSLLQRLSQLEERVAKLESTKVNKQDMQQLRDEINEWTSEAEQQIQGLAKAGRK